MTLLISGREPSAIFSQGKSAQYVVRGGSIVWSLGYPPKYEYHIKLNGSGDIDFSELDLNKFAKSGKAFRIVMTVDDSQETWTSPWYRIDATDHLYAPGQYVNYNGYMIEYDHCYIEFH
jgi:hypothetical protein